MSGWLSVSVFGEAHCITVKLLLNHMNRCPGHKSVCTAAPIDLAVPGHFTLITFYDPRGLYTETLFLKITYLTTYVYAPNARRHDSLRALRRFSRLLSLRANVLVGFGYSIIIICCVCQVNGVLLLRSRYLMYINVVVAVTANHNKHSTCGHA